MSSVDAGRLSVTAPLRRLEAARSTSMIQKPKRSGPPCHWCYCLLTVQPANWEDQLHGQKVQGTTVLCRLKRSDHITNALVSLHWLRVPERIQYKIALLTYKVEKLECGPMPNVMAALPNIGGALC